ncbi:MAG: hypothetical protein ABIQ86_00930 [Steroidobacteraceae bacterium]
MKNSTLSTMAHSEVPARARRSALVLLALVALGGPALAAEPPRPDEPGTGRFPALKEEVASLPNHVVYRPADLSALGKQKLGVLAWGNGGCSENGASVRFHLLEIASHGYLVIATGGIYSGPGAHTPPKYPAPPPGQPAPQPTTAAQMSQAVDWALAENRRAGSPLFGRIDPKQIAYSGHSCGGMQTLKLGGEPRVRTLIVHNSGIPDPWPAQFPKMDLNNASLLALHTPVLYILGGEKDVAYKMGMDNFRRISHVPVAVANLPVAHGGTFNEPNGGAAAAVAVRWLDWQLRGDKKAAKYFVGKDCDLCRDSRWTYERRQFPK